MGDVISYPTSDVSCDHLDATTSTNSNYGRNAKRCCQYLRAQARAHIDELLDSNEALSRDNAAAHRRIIELEAALQASRRNSSLVVELQRRLRESDNSRIEAVQRANELEQQHTIALSHTAAIRRTTEQGISIAQAKVQNLQRANAMLNIRCGEFMQQQAEYTASFATMANQLDVALGHTVAMKEMSKILCSLPAPQAVANIRAAQAEAREAKLRERSLAFAKSALELANRAERTRVEYERAFREEKSRALAAKAADADAAYNELQVDYRVVLAECSTLRRRFADAHEDAEEARARARHLEQTNSSLINQLGAAGEISRSLSVELACAERTAAQSRGLAAKVARLRARCGELAAPGATSAGDEDDDAGDDGTVCVICLDVLAAGETVVRLGCMHVFHRDCIMQCLRSSGVPCCPLCRTQVTGPLHELPVCTWVDNTAVSPVSDRLEPSGVE